jgi:GNAT superfamily N-acetyltransferase
MAACGNLRRRRRRGCRRLRKYLPARDDDAEPASAGELAAIYLVPELWGTGLGRELMASGLSALCDAGFGEATLWVLDTNSRARRFYEAAGWHADGAVKLPLSPPPRQSQV